MGLVQSQPIEVALDPSIPDEALWCADAIYQRACAIVEGSHDLKPDIPRALRLFRSAATRFGHAEAAFRAGKILHMGMADVPKDPAVAHELFETAVKAGHASAMNDLGFMLWRGDEGVRKHVLRAYALMNEAAQRSDDPVAKIRLAKFLLSEDSDRLRNPARAAELLESAVAKHANAFALHELAILYEHGDDGVPVSQERARVLHALAAKATYGSVGITTTGRRIIAAGDRYKVEIEKILSSWYARPNTCLLLTLGGGKRGKTCTMNSMRGIPFMREHVPTEMAALSKFILDPGTRGLDEAVIAEYDFNENSLRANASRLYEAEEREECSVYWRNANDTATQNKSENTSREETTSKAHREVIEKMRRSLTQYYFPRGFKGSVVQIWDMAGQSEYEMAHSLFISRSDILVFVTDLQRFQDAATRRSEVELLCYWMQLAYILVPDPTRVRAVVVGTRKHECGENIAEVLQNLRDCLVDQLAEAVYDAWIRKQGDTEDWECPGSIVAIENSVSEQDPAGSGLEKLEHVVKRAASEIVSQRGRVPIRWLAFVDHLERHSKDHFSRDEILDLATGFPGFAHNPKRREQDIIAGVKCYASTGRVVLFELSEREWFVFTNVAKIIELVGHITKPERRLRDSLSAADVRLLRKGHVTKKTLFKLWSQYSEQDSEVMLKLLFQFDLLVSIRGDGESGAGEALIGIPALLESGWDDFKWGKARGETDVSVSTTFAEAIPNGLISRLLVHLYRVLGSRTTSVNLVRANAVLFEVHDGSRLFIGFRRAQRMLCWQVRSKDPVSLAKQCLRVVEELLESPQRRISTERKHCIVQDCSITHEGCGAEMGVQLSISRQWLFDKDSEQLPIERTPCNQCRKPWEEDEIISLLFGSPEATAFCQRVTSSREYEVFISHAGPDKHVLAHPLYKALERERIHAFLDMEDLRISENTAPEVMAQAMKKAKIGVFILSPEFAARRWPIKELMHFLKRRDGAAPSNSSGPVLLPLFFRLGVRECYTFYDCAQNQQILRDEGFFREDRQAECWTGDAAAALRAITEYSGVEVKRLAGGEDLSSAAIVQEVVQRILEFTGRQR